MARAGATVTVAWSLIKCAGMICNEYIAHKLEGVWQAVELSVCVAGDLMTHLWLRVTLGSGPLKEESTSLATSEHM